MRRALLATLLLLLTAGLGVAPALAQPPFAFGVSSQGVLQYSTASISAVNTTSGVSLWQSLISGALTATAPNVNWSPSSVQTPVPLHLVLHGHLLTNIATAAVGAVNIGVNFGGGSSGVASLALANAWLPQQNLATVPVQLDVWMSPVATATSTSIPGAGPCFFYVSARLHVATTSSTGVLGAANTILDAHTCGTSGGAFLASAQNLNVIWQWASAAATNSLTIYRGVLKYGF